MRRVARVVHMKGHRNSNGELAPWVIKSHEGDSVLSSHKTKEEAVKHLRQMLGHKNSRRKHFITKEASNMRINSQSFAFEKESCEYKELESAIKKIAEANKIDNVESVRIKLSEKSGIVSFKSPVAEEAKEDEK